MKKDRFVAFFDAIMAIIMTIVVLEFVLPSGPDWSDIGQRWTQFAVYALSFFWLGMMWINIHNLWHDIETISPSVLWVNMFMLFFSSMIPFLVVYVGQYFFDPAPQLLYGIDVLLVTVCNEASAELIAKTNDNVKKQIWGFRISISIDLAIKAVGMIVGAFLFPPAVMISVLLAMIFLVIFRIVSRRKLADAQTTEES